MRVTILALLLLLLACKSDAEKLQQRQIREGQEEIAREGARMDDSLKAWRFRLDSTNRRFKK